MAGPITILSGECRGADKLGERFAREWKFEIDRNPALWDDLDAVPCIRKQRSDGTEFNVLAGVNRNEAMALKATHCVVFWDGKSAGSNDMIKLARKYGLVLKVVRY